MALAAAQDVLGHVSLDDTATVIARGGNAAEVWAQAQGASQVLASIEHAWQELAQLMRVSVEQHYPALRIASVDAQTWRARNLHSPPGQRLASRPGGPAPVPADHGRVPGPRRHPAARAG
jgi:hypothetical protein